MGATKRQFIEHEIWRDKHTSTCERCEGKGRVPDDNQEAMFAMMPCPECEGDGIEWRFDR